ncbi:MAG: type I DNA topoisomerase [Armatimonadota bacterium]
MPAKKAIIVESPTKTRTLSSFLSKDYQLLASMGHVRDLPEDEMAVDIEGDFEPHYVVPAASRKTIARLRKALKDADEVYLATDPDREGEAIAWHIREELGLAHARRIQFNEITREAVLEALEHPGEIDMDRVDAQQARRVLDRLVGYSISPVLWRRLGRGQGLSAGRVQSVALRLIVDRERERNAFEPEEYWSIVALLATAGGEQLEAELKTVDGAVAELSCEEQVTPIVAQLREAHYQVAAIEKTQQRRNPRPPFITSTLQRAAANRLHFSARKTMMIAQQLYEGVQMADDAHGLITYMRTDSTHVAESAREQAAAYIQQRWGAKYVGPGARGEKVKRAQEAHEAIRPTDVNHTPEGLREVLSKDQLALYELIWRQFVASQMSAAVVDATRVDIEAGRFGLRASGHIVIFPGWLAVAGRDDEDKVLPELVEGEELSLVELKPEQHFTQPPPRYTEATLVRELEANGVGRPSTYAEIIDTLRRRRYVHMERRQFVPTDLGFAVADYLVDSFPEIMDIEFTAQVEEELDTVERGERDWRQVLREFYGPFEQRLRHAQEAPPEELEGQRCPECGGRLLVRYSRRGKFAGCENYPDCEYTMDLSANGREQGGPEPSKYTCPDCGAPLVIRTGRRGRFFGCTTYPACEYTADVGEDGAPVQRKEPMATGEACPECGGKLILRTGRRGRFLGCVNFPRCRYTRDYSGEELASAASEVVERDQSAQPSSPDDNRVPVRCDECGAPMVVRSSRRGRFLGCTGYPQCKATKPIGAALAAGWEPPEPEKLGEACPECGKDLVVREGKRGKFIGCSGYPKCRYTRDIEPVEEVREAD